MEGSPPNTPITSHIYLCLGVVVRIFKFYLNYTIQCYKILDLELKLFQLHTLGTSWEWNPARRALPRVDCFTGQLECPQGLSTSWQVSGCPSFLRLSDVLLCGWCHCADAILCLRTQGWLPCFGDYKSRYCEHWCASICLSPCFSFFLV